MFIVRPGMQIPFVVAFSDINGNPGSVEAPPVWMLSDPASEGNLVVSGNGMDAKVQHNGSGAGPTGPLGLTVTADGDLGTGVHTITLSDTETVPPPLGSVGGFISAGPEEPIS